MALKKLFSLLLVVSSFLSLPACSNLLKSVVKPPEVKLDQVHVENMGLQSADLIFSLEVFNPNAVDLRVDAVDYKLALNDKPFADGHIQQKAELPGNKKTKIAVPVKVEFKKVFDSLLTAFQKPETQYVISGTAKLGPFSVPFNEKGTLNWRGQGD